MILHERSIQIRQYKQLTGIYGTESGLLHKLYASLHKLRAAKNFNSVFSNTFLKHHHS